MPKLMPGPCAICGAKTYPLSIGGTLICPTCDCGDSFSNLRRQVVQLETDNAQLRKSLAEYDDFARTVTGDKRLVIGSDEWMTQVRAWAASHPQRKHEVDDSRDAIYDDRTGEKRQVIRGDERTPEVRIVDDKTRFEQAR